MAWKNKYFPYFRQPDIFTTSGTFNNNERCFIRKEHKCGKIFGASKSCFIACPSDEELEPLLELISEKLMKAGIEPIIAVKERAYGQDIFCIKICGKIIESKFCIVILDDAIKDDINIPNPNVYYEYGLMTSLRKHIIPLQKDGLSLAFNIQSYDTIKYNNRNLAAELDRAIKEAIKFTEDRIEQNLNISIEDKTIYRKFELAGFGIKDDKWFLSNVIDDTNFKGFGHNSNELYLYLGKIDEKEDLNTYIDDINIVIYRTDVEYNRMQERMKFLNETFNKITKEEQDQELFIQQKSRIIHTRRYEDYEEQIRDFSSKIKLMSKIYFGFIMNPSLDIHDFIEKVNEIIKKNDRYKFSYNINNEIEIDGIKISLSSTNI